MSVLTINLKKLIGLMELMFFQVTANGDRHFVKTMIATRLTAVVISVLMFSPRWC